MDFKRRTILVLFSGFLLSSCMTFSTITKESFPAAKRKHFGKCWRDEGSVSFSATRNNKPVLNAMVDWVRDSSTWRWEIYDPLGRTLFSGIVKDGKFQSSSKIAADFKKVQIRDDGFLYYEDNNLDLKWKEIHCILNYTLPEDWLDLKVMKSLARPKVKEYRVEDKNRSIHLNFEDDRICGVVKGKFMFMERDKFTWCFLKKPARGFMDFEKIFRFEWTKEEEKEDEWTSFSK